MENRSMTSFGISTPRAVSAPAGGWQVDEGDLAVRTAGSGGSIHPGGGELVCKDPRIGVGMMRVPSHAPPPPGTSPHFLPSPRPAQGITPGILEAGAVGAAEPVLRGGAGGVGAGGAGGARKPRRCADRWSAWSRSPGGSAASGPAGPELQPGCYRLAKEV